MGMLPLQFFVATHSPLVAAGGGEDALTLRLDMVGGELQATPIPYLDLAADADRTLRSPAFSLESTYPPPTDRKIKRYHELSRKKAKLIGPEKEEYKQLELFIQEVRPMGIPPEPGSLEARMEAFLEKNLS